MRTEVIMAHTINGAVERVLEELKEDIGGVSSGRRHNVIYFDGWDGLGASTVLREVGRRLAPAATGKKKPTPATTGLDFSQIVNLDCSKWESRRALQRSLAEMLHLPPPVMKMIDAQDEEDDYNGVDKGSRAEIPQVADAIYRHIQRQLSTRFLVIFNNGSCEEIDLESFGFPLSGYSRNKVLWSFQGGFRLYPRLKVDSALESMKTTDVVLSAASDPDPEVSGFNLSDILYHEAAEVAHKVINNASGINWTAAAIGCFLYMMKLYRMSSHLMDYDLTTHSCNYWKCDGIIQLQHGTTDDDRVWLSYDALQQEMRLDVGYYQSQSLPPPVRHLSEQVPYWASPKYGFMLIPDQSGHIPKGMFLQYDKLCVLKLSGCTFSLTSPPFLCCHSLRFLWLDHCQEESSSRDGAGNEEDMRRCFQSLWVLDVRYSSSKFLSKKMMDFMPQLQELHVMGQKDFNMAMLQGRLHNIRKLRVTKSNTYGPYLLSGKDNMQHLELLENGGYMRHLSVDSSSCSNLETIIIDGYVSLEEISLKGWAKPENLLFSGSFPGLHSLDLSGAAVKTLDLSAVMAPKLDNLLLLECVKLIAILWPKAAAAAAPEGKGRGERYLSKLRIATTQKLEDDTGSSRSSHAGSNWHICVRDARLLRSLEPVKDYFGDNEVHLDISTRMPSSLDAASSCKDVGSKLQDEVDQDNYYYATKADVAASAMQQQQADDSAIMSTCPPAPGVSSRGCYMHIEDNITDAAAGGSNNEITVPGFICDGVKILHVHDSLFVIRIVFPAASESNWDKLEWCRVEQCPKLECIFSSNSAGGYANHAFGKLRTIWASHLTNARYIMDQMLDAPLFQGLTSLHLYCCPRMSQALPWTISAVKSLETLEIMWCGDLNTVFKNGDMTSPMLFVGVWEFPKLKHLHLHELPKLCGVLATQVPKPMALIIYAPNLESIKIRGCWSLRMLPLVGSKKVVSCACEKEWWDKLEWYSRMQRSQYKQIHSQHYKKTFIRGSALR